MESSSPKFEVPTELCPKHPWAGLQAKDACRACALEYRVEVLEGKLPFLWNIATAAQEAYYFYTKVNDLEMGKAFEKIRAAIEELQKYEETYQK